MKHLNHHNVAELQQAGYEIFEVNMPADGGAPGCIVVADPVLCTSGNKRWAEVRRVTLRTPAQVYRFISDRS